MYMTKARLCRAVSGVLAAGVLGVLLLPSPSRQAGSFIAHNGPTASGELIVHFGPEISAEQQAAVLSVHGATLSRNLLVPGYVVAIVPAGTEAMAGEALAQSGVVVTVEEDPIRELASAPNDPYYPQQWNMQEIGLGAAREQSDGSGVTVAVLDTGVAYEDYQDGATEYRQAPDFAATTFVKPCNVFVAPPPQNDPPHCPDPHANDDYGHGTHVTGTIAENTNNGISAAGIAPKAKIMPIKVCGPYPDPAPPPNDPNRKKYGCDDKFLADGIEYAVENGADIINLSIADPVPLIAAVRAALDDAQRAGVVVVAASGNGKDGVGNGTLDYPAAIDSVISVGATGLFENLAGYSNYGVGEGNHLLDLVAPGGDLLPGDDPNNPSSKSVVLQQTYAKCASDPHDYTPQDFTFFPETTRCQGTSMAAPHVSGVAALIKSKFPNLTATQIRDDLRCSADDLGTAGPDQYFGNGLVRADAALTDIDHDGTPDCIDPSVVTPHPTPIPPSNECVPSTFTPPPPTLSPSPTQSTPPTPTSTGPTATPSDTVISSDSGTAGVSPTDTGTPTSTATPTDTPTATPSDTPTASDTTTGTPTPSPTPTPTPTPTPLPTPIVTPRPICGDVDCSGAVNAADALGLLRWLTEASPSAQCIGLGYVNCDGQLDVVDAMVILRHSAALLTNLPAGCSGLS